MPDIARGIMRSMSSPAIGNLDTLRQQIRAFAEARAWERFHSPKNLAMALSVEAAELLEPFQWLTPEQSQHLSAEQREAVRQEIADVLDIDLLEAAADKLALNARKYPVEKAHGNALKSTEFTND